MYTKVGRLEHAGDRVRGEWWWSPIALLVKAEKAAASQAVSQRDRKSRRGRGLSSEDLPITCASGRETSCFL